MTWEGLTQALRKRTDPKEINVHGAAYHQATVILKDLTTQELLEVLNSMPFDEQWTVLMGGVCHRHIGVSLATLLEVNIASVAANQLEAEYADSDKQTGGER